MSKTASNSKPAAATAGGSPFRHPAFRLLWSVTLVSNIGTWMHEVGAGWLMTSLDPSPRTVTLVQAAATLPIFCLALFAGALADRLDKRKLLIVTNVALMLVVAVLAVLTQAGQMTPALLVGFTFLVGAGAAFAAPAWQAIVPQLVPREELSSALALNSLGINISRAIGPAIAGVLITAVGLAAPFALNALSCVVAAVGVYLWRAEPTGDKTLPPEPLLGSLATGLRHAANNGPLKATLKRALVFFLAASAFWSLLPLIARGLPGGGSGLYGTLLASIGAGAVLGALIMPTLRRHLDSNRMSLLASVGLAAALLIFALIPIPAAAVGAALLGGLSWIATMVSLNLSAQSALPNWVRARGLALFLMVFSGGMTVGALIWGQVGELTSVSTALVIAAVALLAPLPFLAKIRLGQGEDLDLSPALAWEKPVVASALGDVNDAGPVMVTIEYRVDEDDRPAFVRTLRTLSESRYRDGAHGWGLYQDLAEPDLWIEWFLLPSWAEHLRQHERATTADEDVHATAQSFHRGTGRPEVRHFIAAPSGESI